LKKNKIKKIKNKFNNKISQTTKTKKQNENIGLIENKKIDNFFIQNK